ncbi:nucleoside ABC transporter ATP-binding protein [Faunimonas pinastri]|uniref:Nucleoside ABC transporter ATP-binding protein n=1 Tax=Faunimonas pinastri TaxID=1855383 RepID=A0A1H9LA92_9HYPH|nr:ABC transporter ATP-binding protein [Faunimonas pinastri]SER08149.1 nucleoside ABC transporter ATP-binding protein [Faunimonas pinastri]
MQDLAAAAADHGVQPLLRADGLTKRFGALTACDHIRFEIQPGEVHALLGENGAGKSTLVKMLYGALEPDEGQIVWNGQPVRIGSPAEARRLGIGMVFQHFSLFEALSVAENIALALPHLPRRTLADTISRVSKSYGLPLDPRSTVADLSVGERQRVEIVRCLLQEPRLIIMDEPTSVLTPQEVDLLFVTLRRLSSEGVAILYITHRLSEVLALANHATILRRGKVVETADPAQETAGSLARMMVGSEVLGIERPPAVTGTRKPRLVLSNLSLSAEGQFGTPLSGIDLTVNAGEVVGIAGVAGNGQQEFFDAVSGERTAATDQAILIDGVQVGRRGVNARRKLGAAFVPEERMGHGAVSNFRLSENVILTRHATDNEVARGGFLHRRIARDVEERVGERYDVRRSTADPKAGSLSGGNLQKFVVGREIDRSPGVLVVSQPTWGVDAGAARTIRSALVDLARGGAAVLVISQDLDEIFEIADRIAVLSEGRLSTLYPAESLTMERIGLLMGGIHGEQAGEDAPAALKDSSHAS